MFNLIRCKQPESGISLAMPMGDRVLFFLRDLMMHLPVLFVQIWFVLRLDQHPAFAEMQWMPVAAMLFAIGILFTARLPETDANSYQFYRSWISANIGIPASVALPLHGISLALAFYLGYSPVLLLTYATTLASYHALKTRYILFHRTVMEALEGYIQLKSESKPETSES